MANVRGRIDRAERAVRQAILRLMSGDIEAARERVRSLVPRAEADTIDEILDLLSWRWHPPGSLASEPFVRLVGAALAGDADELRRRSRSYAGRSVDARVEAEVARALGSTLSGRPERGFAALDAVARAAPADAGLARIAARAALRIEREAVAKEHAARAIAYDPEDGRAWLLMALALEREGYASAAIAAREKARELGRDPFAGDAKPGCQAASISPSEALAKIVTALESMPCSDPPALAARLLTIVAGALELAATEMHELDEITASFVLDVSATFASGRAFGVPFDSVPPETS